MREQRATSRWTWIGVGILLVACVVGVTASLSVRRATGGGLLDGLLGIGVVAGFGITGTAVLAARPRHLVGWLLVVGGAAWAVGNGAIDLAAYSLRHPGSLPATSLLALGGAVVRDVGWYAVVLGLPIYFPTGRIAGPRWRWLPRGLVVVTVASVADTLAAPDANLMWHDWHNPLSLPARLWYVDSLAFLLSLPLALVVAGGAVLQLRQRWRAGSALERQQVAFVALTAGLPVLAGPVSFVPGAPASIFTLAVLPLPVAVGYAVLARGLYDLRNAANRAVVWLLLSAGIAGLYALVIASVGGVVDRGRATWLPAVAVGVVAVSFAPLRDLLQRAVDRVMFGRWRDPYAVLARLGQRLEATAEIDRLLDEAVIELAALGLRSVRIESVRGEVLAASPEQVEAPDRAEDDQIALLVYGERVGTLRFSPPPAGLRPADRRLLEDLAVHLGGVLHDHRLTEELQRALERVVLAREEERRRLRRDLHDGLGPALAGHLLRLEVIARELPPGSRAASLVAALREDVHATVLDVRRVVEGLRPPALDELGLAGAVEQAVHRLTSGSGIRVELEVSDLPPLPAAIEVAAFRILTEAVTNAVRHASAHTCTVSLRAGQASLRVSVEDDGVGLGSVLTTGNGLHTMRERAEEVGGRLSVAGEGGTRVSAEIPLTPAALSVAAT